MTDEKPSIREQYVVAMNSTHLEAHAERLRAVDRFIVAGWVAGGAVERQRLRRVEQRRRLQGLPPIPALEIPVPGAVAPARITELGPLLLRLAQEWDSVKAQHALSLRWQEAREVAIRETARDLAREQQALAKAPGRDASRAVELAESLRRQQREAHGTAVSEQAMMLTKLRTLPAAREALGRWALAQASKWPVQGLPHHARPAQVREAMAANPLPNDDGVMAIVGRVLKAWLSPRCAACGGTGLVFQHASGKKAKRTEAEAGYGHLTQCSCGACKGTGLVRESLGETDSERRFAHHLLDRMGEMLTEVERAMRDFLRGREA
ncbi:hypothetical protein [Azohydromonas aeria]|uniref:hypothetical protein n=1 Tax=Azohydromonas aeria TaxID=2590212 RepID=UPI0012F94BFF|nr:hypothetical protein [Azohydromonas aeria]